MSAASLPPGRQAPAGQPENGGRRERRRQEVRERLYAAAIALFVEHGFTETTMDAIAEQADVARATVFNHFSQKVGFLEEWGRHRRARVAAILGGQQFQGRPVAEQLRLYLSELAKINVAARRESVVLMDASARYGGLFREPSLDVELAWLIEGGQRTGEVRSDVDAAQTGAILAAGYFSAVLRWIATEPPPFSLPDQIDAMLDIVLRGVLSDAGSRGPAAATRLPA